MANPEHVEIVKQGAKAIGAWRETNPRVTVDVSEANLSRAGLSEANLRSANLSEANLSGANLSEANLRCANLSGANLIAADLREADLREADLIGADLRGANLRSANLSWANLSEANLEKSQIGWTIFGNVDVAAAKEVRGVEHDGPSAIAVDTLTKSKGAIPEAFLRGCGFSPWQILDAKLYDPALTAAEITDLQYKIFDARAHGPIYLGGVFISYSHVDSKFVDKVRERLQKEGAPVWLDRHDMVAGPLQKQVARAIRMNDAVLLVLSEASVKSDWVENELDMARRKEKKEDRDVLCPVALDDSWKTKLDDATADRQLWRKLTQKNILDFSQWKTKAFNDQFQKLLRGLKIWYEPKK